MTKKTKRAIKTGKVAKWVAGLNIAAGIMQHTYLTENRHSRPIINK